MIAIDPLETVATVSFATTQPLLHFS